MATKAKLIFLHTVQIGKCVLEIVHLGRISFCRTKMHKLIVIHTQMFIPYSTCYSSFFFLAGTPNLVGAFL